LHNVKQEPYTMILVDWKMPQQDGIEVTRMIRERYKESATIIILTAYNWDDILEEAIDAGVDSFMAKPLFASNVLTEFENIVKSKHYQDDEEVKAELSGKRILLAEDVEINAEIMKAILEAKNIYVKHAQNGSEALEIFSKSKEEYFDAILMDVRMPVMNGLEAASAIRALNRKDSKNIPIIALTANAFDEDVQNSLQAGMNAHLSKPVEMDRLYDTLEKLIGKRQK
ncbi:MAG: response regulator, partial [Firmicutes bacterium]|nr:response regulator [Bacillota bacterium]